MNRQIFQSEEWGFPFIGYFPNVMAENLPLIVQLHGAGERGKGGTEIGKVDVHG